MDNNNKKYCGLEIELMLLKTFIRHIRHHNLYVTFRRSINLMNYKRDIYHILNRNNSNPFATPSTPFSKCRNVMDILHTFSKVTSVATFDKRDECQFQRRVMDCVNALLHFCIEPNFRGDFKVLAEIGENVYNEVCKNIYGEGFVDHMNGDARGMEAIEELKAKMGEGMIPNIDGMIPSPDTLAVSGLGLGVDQEFYNQFISRLREAMERDNMTRYYEPRFDEPTHYNPNF